MAEFRNYMKRKYQNVEFGMYVQPRESRVYEVPGINVKSWSETAAGLRTIFNTYQVVRIIVRPYDRFTETIMGYAMKHFTPADLQYVFRAMNLDRLEDSIDVFYNLLWYINISQKTDEMNLTAEERSFVSGLSIPELIDLLGPNYRGPRDKASLIFAALSGKSAPFPNIQDLPKYDQVKNYPPRGVWNICNILHQIGDTFDNGRYNFGVHPPYVFVSLIDDDLDLIYAYVNPGNVRVFAEKYGIIGGNAGQRDNNNLYKYFLREIQDYSDKLNRAPGLPPNPDIKNLTARRIREILQPYTEKEIVDGYEIKRDWIIRSDLFHILSDVSHHGTFWFMRNKWCNNDNTMNLFTFETHGEMDKNDNADPVIAFGYPGNYRCYQMSELAESFREIDGMFKFFVPDYQENTIDPSTGEQLIQEFSVESIRQLQYVLENAPRELNVAPLLQKINTGLEIIEQGNNFLETKKREYLALPEDQKSIVDLYLAWLFFYGMWLRYWKGPGNPYPLNIRTSKEIMCRDEDRHRYTYIQQGVYKMIKNASDNYPGLSQWIDSLPICNYDFTGRTEVKISTDANSSIKSALDMVETGRFCMTHASDLFLQTGFYLITTILDKPDLAQFNNFITGQIPRLLETERVLVNYQLQTQEEKQDRDIGGHLKLLRKRSIELNKPFTGQEPFDPAGVRETGHLDHQGRQFILTDDQRRRRLRINF